MQRTTSEEYSIVKILSMTNFIGERIYKIRKELGLTLEELGERVGVSGAALSNIENGKRMPSRPLASTLAQTLGVREEWLLAGEEPVYDEPILLSDFDESHIAKSYVEMILNSAGVEVSPAERVEYERWYLKRLRELQKDFRNLIQGAEITQKKRRKGIISNIIEGNFKGATIQNPQGDIAGRDIIKTERHTSHTTNTPPPDSINESQAREIQSLLVRIGELESNRLGPKAYGIVMNQFKNKYKITSYKNLKSHLYEDAVADLKKRTKVLESELSKSGYRPVTRDEYIRRIQTISRRELHWTDPIRRDHMLKYIGKSSLTEFTISELEAFYRYVVQKKQRV